MEPNARTTLGTIDDSSEAERAAIVDINERCRNEKFPEKSFLSAVSSGPLLTVVDDDGNVISAGNTWATFDTWCVTQAILDFHDEEFAYPEQRREHASTTDVTETTLAAYAMLNFEGDIGRTPVRGNLGLRVVDTEVESVGYRAAYEISQADDGTYSIAATGEMERVSVSDSYLEWLPSLNVVADFGEDLLLRGAVFRAISRADPGDLGYQRTFTARTGADDATDPNDLISSFSGSGNPFTQALPSWNFDLALEWYPTPDSILAGGVYLKRFTGGFEQVQRNESLVVDGRTLSAPITVTETTNEESNLYGIEITAAHRFENGLGFKLSYNWADSDFEFEDSNYGDVTILDVNGEVLSQRIGIIPPGNVPGFSKQTFSGQLYYQIRDFDLQLIYKYRSDYFQPYTSNGTRLRFVDDVGVWEARASYRLNENYKFTIEAINLFDEPKTQYFYVADNLGEINSYGARIFFGVKAKF